FLTRENQQWIGNGYVIGTPAAGFGSLYRFSSNCPVSVDPNYLLTTFLNYSRLLLVQNFVTNALDRVADGIVHLKVRAYDPKGYLITNTIALDTNNLPLTVTNIFVVDSTLPRLGGEPANYSFTDVALPASVEFELGVLEDRVLARLKAIPN